MKKYKHRKTGEIATYQDGILKSSGFCVEIGVEPSNEYWEEIVEIKKDYEILKFHYSLNRIYNVLEDGNLLWDIPEYKGIKTNPSACHWTEATKKGYQIYSVKRLSDGEIFSIGDKCNNDIIKKFKLFDNNTRIYVVSENRTWGLNINELIKDKQPLFITEDGISIFNGDWFLRLNPISFKITPVKTTALSSNLCLNGELAFSTKEAAKNYILENKPCLSLKDVKDCYNYAPKGSPLYDNLIDNLKLKIKEKNV